MDSAKTVTFTLVVAWVFAMTYGYANGPPPSACVTMLPEHNTSQTTHSPQTTPSPYSITPSATTYMPGEVIQVQLSTSGSPFLGVFIQARKEGTTNAIGKFTVATGDNHIKAISCDSQIDNAVGHYAAISSTSKTFNWKVPPNTSGHIRFRGTFVKNFATFWTEVDSPAITRRDQHHPH